MNATGSIVMLIFIIIYVFSIVQMFLGYGTAYRLTKRGGDDGIALFGWIILMSFAAIVPGLGIYLWNKYKNIDDEDYEDEKSDFQ